MNKVYLSGIQEITKALKDGKVVFEEDTDNKIDKYRAIRVINGILISSYIGNNHDSIFMNDYICLNGGGSKFYIEEKEPIKLEVGKFYKTRDGEKVCCFYKYKSNVYDFNWAFIKVNEQPDRAIFKSRDNGRQWTSENAYHGDDIVDYWKE